MDVDVSVFFRIKDAYKVVSTYGTGRTAFFFRGIYPLIEPKLKETLGQMTTDEFYNSPLRFKKSQLSLKLLNDSLGNSGLLVEQILIRQFRYSPEFQKRIDEKKLQDQLFFTNQAETKREAAAAEVRKVVEEGKAKVSIKLEEGNAYKIKINADQSLYRRTKAAEGELAIGLAEAYNIKLQNEALRGKGSNFLLGIEMTNAFNNLEAIILPSDGRDGLNPIDIHKTLKLFQVTK